mmetsp:Transcript_1899/g.5551  ORF Transcript_1899/g.5551 Transcript_1899/m.5551 type:complete len:738 (-) Transcript_1899:661-2874(-)
MATVVGSHNDEDVAPAAVGAVDLELSDRLGAAYVEVCALRDTSRKVLDGASAFAETLRDVGATQPQQKELQPALESFHSALAEVQELLRDPAFQALCDAAADAHKQPQPSAQPLPKHLKRAGSGASDKSRANVRRSSINSVDNDFVGGASDDEDNYSEYDSDEQRDSMHSAVSSYSEERLLVVRRNSGDIAHKLRKQLIAIGVKSHDAEALAPILVAESVDSVDELRDVLASMGHKTFFEHFTCSIGARHILLNYLTDGVIEATTEIRHAAGRKAAAGADAKSGDRPPLAPPPAPSPSSRRWSLLKKYLAGVQGFAAGLEHDSGVEAHYAAHFSEASEDPELAGKQLLAAAKHGNVEMAAAVLAKHVGALGARGSGGGARSNPGCTPLCHAAHYNHAAIVKLLLSRGAAVDEADDYGWTPLCHAAQCGRVEAAELLVEAGADASAKTAAEGFTPLWLGAQANCADVVHLLFDAGADVNAPDRRRWTPLHTAAASGYLELARLLLDRGAEIEAEDESAATPLFIAAQYGKDEVLQLLIGYGADADAPYKSGATPLAAAAARGHVGACAMLLDKGTDANTPDLAGNTPLHAAAAFGHDAVCRLLLDHGAEVLAWSPSLGLSLTTTLIPTLIRYQGQRGQQEQLHADSPSRPGRPRRRDAAAARRRRGVHRRGQRWLDAGGARRSAGQHRDACSAAQPRGGRGDAAPPRRRLPALHRRAARQRGECDAAPRTRRRRGCAG